MPGPLWRLRPRGTLVLFVGGLLFLSDPGGLARAGRSSSGIAGPPSSRTSGQPRSWPVLTWPGANRSELALPDTLWERILGPLGRGDRPLGYSFEQMANYGRDQLRLRTVETLFRDVRALPRMSGKLAEDLMANAAHPPEILSRAFALTDVSSGRNLTMPDSASWGVPWLRDTTSPASALDSVLVRSFSSGGHRPGSMASLMAARDRREWEDLPAHMQRLVLRVLIGAIDANPYFDLALKEPLKRFPTHDPDSLYRSVTAPWREDRLGQLVTRNSGSLRALWEVDRDYLAFGAILFLTHLDRALAEYRQAKERADSSGGPICPPGFHGCTIPTGLGPVRITGEGRDTLTAPSFFSLDLGGDDLYRGRQAVPMPGESPIALVLDLAGNDLYEGGKESVTLACGLFGLGALFDLSGNDTYRCTEAGLGAAWYGVGVLYDGNGNDTYMIDSHAGQGSGCAGVGMLIDLAGNDSYTCGYGAQGYGETLGAGVLLDVTGNDVYLARDDGNPDALYNNQSVSMAQGVGQGRRADLGDGHSLAGGFGVLIDGAGDDSYHASAWSQGAGYWWSVGILEDLGGNDRYRNGKYASGAAAHFALGCQVDLSGNDLYNIGNTEAVNQYQGHARDGSIGVSIDGDGDDQYQFRSHCGGSADLNSIGFFWDRRGQDLYELRYESPAQPNGWNDTPPLGTATVYTPFRSFRDDLNAVGLFLDTGGRDQYRWLPVASDSTDSTGHGNHGAVSGPSRERTKSPIADDTLRAALGDHTRDDAVWTQHRGQASWGIGMDEPIYGNADSSPTPSRPRSR